VLSSKGAPPNPSSSDASQFVPRFKRALSLPKNPEPWLEFEAAAMRWKFLAMSFC
jgi:hypothetical protein